MPDYWKNILSKKKWFEIIDLYTLNGKSYLDEQLDSGMLTPYQHGEIVFYLSLVPDSTESLCFELAERLAGKVRTHLWKM